MTLSPQFLDELRIRTTLSALVAKSVKLQRSGNEFKACCPFHTEKTPSFWVNDDKGFYHCFGCGAHGDAIRWMTDQRGLPFIDAVKELVAAAGMDMPAQGARSKYREERAAGLHEVLADAQRWYALRLRDSSGVDARAALLDRGITPQFAEAFGLGFAPDQRTALRTALAHHGDHVLAATGMLITVDGKAPYDRFRGRLMIPIRDARGRTIAFGGRILGDGEPKYLNSPETPLFDKGRTLYNIDRAQAAARKAKRMIAVEGYMDVIALAQAGFDEVVAPLGTALTEHQLERLWRMADVPILCFDGDAAGIKAARRAAERALPLLQPGKSIAIVTIPDGMDPDDLVRAKGAQAFEDLLARRESLSDFLWRLELATLPPGAGPDERAALEHELARLAGTITHEAIRREYLRTFRQRCREIFWRPLRSQVVTPLIPPADVTTTIVHAMIYGVVSDRGGTARQLEMLAELRIANPSLAAIRDRVVDELLHDRPISPIAPPRLVFSSTDASAVLGELVAGQRQADAVRHAKQRLLADCTHENFARYQSARGASGA